MNGIHFKIGLIGKSSFLPLCVMAPGCYACVYETQYRARGLGMVERGAGNCKHMCCNCSIWCLWCHLSTVVQVYVDSVNWNNSVADQGFAMGDQHRGWYTRKSVPLLGGHFLGHYIPGHKKYDQECHVTTVLNVRVSRQNKLPRSFVLTIFIDIGSCLQLIMRAFPMKACL